MAGTFQRRVLMDWPLEEKGRLLKELGKIAVAIEVFREMADDYRARFDDDEVGGFDHAEVLYDLVVALDSALTEAIERLDNTFLDRKSMDKVAARRVLRGRVAR